MYTETLRSSEGDFLGLSFLASLPVKTTTACPEVLCDLGGDSKSFCFESCGKKRTGNFSEAYGESFDVGDTIHCEVGKFHVWFCVFGGDVTEVFQPTKKL